MLHRCLEMLTTTGAYDVDRIMAEFPDLLKLDPATVALLVYDMKTVLDQVLADSSLAWIFAQSQQAYSELPFLYKRGNSLVSGMIDRLVIRGGQADVIDYKAIHITDDSSLAAWIDHYRPQIQVYCEAVQQLFGLSEVRGHLLFLDSALLKLTTKV